MDDLLGGRDRDPTRLGEGQIVTSDHHCEQLGRPVAVEAVRRRQDVLAADDGAHAVVTAVSDLYGS